MSGARLKWAALMPAVAWLCVLQMGLGFLNPAPASAASIDQARDAVMPFVVSVMVVREDHLQGRGQLSLSSGSGTIISAQGHVATNAHVTENGQRFRVVLADKRELPATLVGVDELSDIAVLKINEQPAEGFAFASFAEQQFLQAGDTVLAMGAPWGLAQSLSQGVVNNPARVMVSLFQDEADYEQQLGRNQPTARFYAWIQHDAAIAPGNSGGPLVDLSGDIVGINTRANMAGGDMAFAIPGAVAKRIVEQLIAHGEVERSYFGFGIRSLKGSGLREGVLVSSVQGGSPADQAGLQAGDRIVRIDGRTVSVAQPEQVPDFLRGLTERALNSKLDLDVEGAEGARSISMRSLRYPPDLGENIEIKSWGLTLTEVTPAIARARLLEHAQGLIVTGVLPGGRAAIAHPPLQPGDVLFSLNGKAVAQVQDLAALNAVDKASDASQVMELERAGKSMLVLLDAKTQADQKRGLRELPKPWIGLETQPITATTARAIVGPEGGGYRVTRVYPGPAKTAGIRVGDFITALAGEKIPVTGDSNDEALQQRIRDVLVEEPIALNLWRDGKWLEVAVHPGIAPESNGRLKTANVDWLDMGVRELGFFDRIERRLENNQQGVIVDRVESGGLAGLANIMAGDLILQVNGRPVRDLKIFQQLVDRSKRPVDGNMSFLVLRAARTRLLFLDSGWEMTP